MSRRQERNSLRTKAVDLAVAWGSTEQAAYCWLQRYRAAGGDMGLLDPIPQDRPVTPRRPTVAPRRPAVAHRVPARATVAPAPPPAQAPAPAAPTELDRQVQALPPGPPVAPLTKAEKLERLTRLIREGHLDAQDLSRAIITHSELEGDTGQHARYRLEVVLAP